GERTLVLNPRPQNDDAVAAFGIAEAASSASTATVTAEGDGFVLDNGRVRAAIDGRGLLVSLIDAASGREAIAPGAAGNLLQLFRDIPNKWDAWDIDEHYRRVGKDLVDVDAIRAEQDDRGAAVVVERSFGGSRIVETIRLDT